MKSNKSETQIGDVVAHIERDLSREETVRYFADAFREYGGTDLCLMLPGGMADGQMHPYGISGKLYEGELHANELTVLLPNAGKPVPTLAPARISGEDLRAVFRRYAPSFMRPMVWAFIMRSVSGVAGACRVTTSETASSSSRLT